MHVYVFKKFRGNYYGGKETIELFTDKDTAVKRIRENVEEDFLFPFDKAEECLRKMYEEVTFNDTSVYIDTGIGIFCYSVEKHGIH